MLLLVGMLVVGGLVLVKLWQTSPPGVEPVIKVSVLDLLQSRSLAATARRDAAAGEIDKSLHAWGGALANNLANAELWRELLEQLAADTSVTNDLAAPYLTSVGWFCTLTRTNAADVVLAARVCERHDAFEELAALPLPDSPEAVPELTALRLQGLFRLGRIYEFIPLFERNREQLAEQPGFDLYRLAYL
ncbi:MAG: hypothetical protein KDM81_07690, partial [Verrucomicrobiae bacterium]|nr:hypothetical protein [Verrucomicrobiae bacterium]